MPYKLNYTSRENLLLAATSLTGKVSYIWGGGHEGTSNIDGINQVQVTPKANLTFASALRSILRQDPNIIMIGEIRDTETAKIAVRASITGHLVLSTIHTNNSLNTIERLIDMDVQKYLLASALEGVIAQKLARRLCEHCKKKRATTNYEKSVFKAVLASE